MTINLAPDFHITGYCEWCGADCRPGLEIIHFRDEAKRLDRTSLLCRECYAHLIEGQPEEITGTILPWSLWGDNRSRTGFDLVIAVDESGTLYVRAADGQNECWMYPSYLSDALTDFVTGVLTLFNPRNRKDIVIPWADEPGEWRWILGHEKLKITLRILEFDETFSRRPNSAGRVIFSAECGELRFLTEVRRQLHAILRQHGEVQYKERWCHPFPMRQLQQLDALYLEYDRTIDGSLIH